MKPWRTNAPDGLDRDQGAIVLSFGRARKQTEALRSGPESLRIWPRSCAHDPDATENGRFKKRSKSRLTSAVLRLVRA